MVENKPFMPVVNKDSKILILGSYPSVKSREQQFYYANPQNRFWNTLYKIFNLEITESCKLVSFKKEFLKTNKIALWDIVKNCDIKGSSDSDIKNISKNDVVNLEEFLNEYKNIKVIICNGKKAYNLTNKYFKNLNVVYLPSTSPANTSFSFDVWKKEIEKYL